MQDKPTDKVLRRLLNFLQGFHDDDDDDDDDDNNNNNNNKSVETSREGKVTMSWNQQEQTDRTIPNNKPDVTICDNGKGTFLLTDVTFQETDM